MPKIIRTFGLFYDAGPNFAVEKDAAVDVAQRAAGLVGKFAGAIVLNDAKGARFPSGMTSLDAEKVRFGSDTHSLLVTGRYAADGPMLGGVSAAGESGANGVATWSRTIVSLLPHDPNRIAAATEASRAIAYGLGVSGCTNMFECITGNPMTALMGKEFCGLCAARLAVGGQIAAGQLPPPPPQPAN